MMPQGSTYGEYSQGSQGYQQQQPMQGAQSSEKSNNSDQYAAKSIEAGGSLIGALLNTWEKQRLLNRQRKADAQDNAFTTMSQSAALMGNQQQGTFGELMGTYRNAFIGG